MPTMATVSEELTDTLISRSIDNGPLGVGYNFEMFSASSMTRSSRISGLFEGIAILWLIIVTSTITKSAWANATLPTTDDVDLADAVISSTSANRILILGDSLSAGYGIALNESWPSLLQAKLADQDYDHIVVNASISGETTSGGLTRLSKLLDEHKPDLVAVELGANDGLRGLPVQHVEKNFLSIFDLARGAGAGILLFEMRVPPNYGPRYEQRFGDMYRNLAESPEVLLVPFFLIDVVLVPGLMQADGLHPTARAQPIILDHVWPYFEQSITSRTTAVSKRYVNEILQ